PAPSLAPLCPHDRKRELADELAGESRGQSTCYPRSLAAMGRNRDGKGKSTRNRRHDACARRGRGGGRASRERGGRGRPLPASCKHYSFFAATGAGDAGAVFFPFERRRSLPSGVFRLRSARACCMTSAI